jgi:3-methylfumaryl-CoA hydratase
LDIEQLQSWIGKTERATDEATATPVAALAATLDIDHPGDTLRPLWHWLYFLPIHRQSDLGPDGHAKRGGFLPPVDLPRRMWAGGRLEFHHPLHIGDRITRTSRIADVRFKEGRAGPLVFVVVRHEIANEAGVALTEEHDIVYRDHARSGDPQPAPNEATWQRLIHPDDVLLFRYSALTFNGHRIHYDRRYATEVEHYPGLVVHGPLIATLLADLVSRNLPEATMKRFEFRAISPIFDVADFTVNANPEPDGKTIHLWASGPQGGLAMTATADLT